MRLHTVVILFFLTLTQVVKPQASNWIGEYHGAGDIYNFSNAKLAEEKGVEFKITQESDGKIRVHAKFYTSDSDARVGRSYGGNDVSIWATNIPTSFTNSSLMIEEQYSNRIYKIDISKSGNVITGTAERSDMESSGNIVDKGRFSFYVQTLGQGGNVNTSYYQNWIGEKDGAGDILNKLDGQTVTNCGVEMKIERSSGDKLRVHLTFRTSNYSAKKVCRGSAANAVYMYAKNVPESISNNSLEIHEQFLNHLYEIKLNWNNNLISGHAVRKTMRSNGSIYEDGSYNFSITATPLGLYESEIIPEKNILLQNYPNPFNPSTKIKFGLPEESDVSLVVFNISGEEVTQLLNQQLKAGYHEVDFNNSSFSSGIYFYRIQATPSGGQAGDYVETKKMILLK